MATDLTTQAEAARLLGVQPYVISVVIHRDGIPTEPNPYNGKARCLNAEGMARLRLGVEAYKRNRQIADAACA